MRRWLCIECSEVVVHGVWDDVPDPGSDRIWPVCRSCRAPESFVAACWKCDRRSSMGTPTVSGYVNSCGEHAPEHDRKSWERWRAEQKVVVS